MKLIVPCKGCEKREVGCHAVCKEYITYRKMKDKQNAQMKKNAMQEQTLNDIEKTRKRKASTGAFYRSRRAK